MDALACDLRRYERELDYDDARQTFIEDRTQEALEGDYELLASAIDADKQWFMEELLDALAFKDTQSLQRYIERRLEKVCEQLWEQRDEP